MNFRKLLLGVALVPVLMSAQTDQKPEYVFQRHAFMQLQGGVGYTVGEAKFGDLITPAVAGYIGYKFSPVFGLRAGVSGWQAKGKFLTYDVYKYHYLQANLDAMFSLTNLFCGFNPKRVFDSYLFVGIGGAHAYHNGEATIINNLSHGGLENFWGKNKNMIAGRAGLGASLRLSDIVSINLEVNANLLPDKFNNKKADNVDWQLNGLLGLNIKFGKGYKTIMPAPVVVPEPEPAPEPEPEPVVVVEEVVEEVIEVPVVEPLTENIFFLINSAVIRDIEQPKVTALIEYLNENTDATVSITGYASKESGTKAYNMALSQRRADAVANALKKAGIAADRIKVAYEGATIQPFPAVNAENRVAICVAAPVAE